jgi:Fic family protein
MPTTHMTHTTESNGFNFSDFFLGILFLTTFLLILAIIILLLVFKDQIRSRFTNKDDFDKSIMYTNLSKKSIENPLESENRIQDSESLIVENYGLSYSIDEQAYQRERLMNLINNYPEGILQSKLPNLTNLSKATVSRRIGELVEKELIMREPRGRSILITAKNA